MGEHHPYKQLGQLLKELREKAKETLGEVSGAVEVRIDELTKMEEGTIRPTEDILSLFIAHYDLKDGQAEKLWKLAGYDVSSPEGSGQNPTQQTVMVSVFDARIVYADMLHATINKFGVVLNFMQGAGPHNQPLAIARVGMSKEHAISVIEVLQRTLDQADQAEKPKRLAAPDDTKPDTSS
jgi:hypothetical protein